MCCGDSEDLVDWSNNVHIFKLVVVTDCIGARQDAGIAA